MNVHFRFLNGISFSSAFSLTAENEKMLFGRPVLHHAQKGLGLKMQSLGLEH